MIKTLALLVGNATKYGFVCDKNSGELQIITDNPDVEFEYRKIPVKKESVIIRSQSLVMDKTQNYDHKSDNITEFTVSTYNDFATAKAAKVNSLSIWLNLTDKQTQELLYIGILVDLEKQTVMLNYTEEDDLPNTKNVKHFYTTIQPLMNKEFATFEELNATINKSFE